MRSLLVAIGLAVIAFAALALSLLLRPQPAADPAPPDMPKALDGRPQGGVYTSAIAEPADINPLTCREVTARHLLLGVTHDALLDRDPDDGHLRAALADAYEPHPDGLGCTFHLRPGVTFADGRSLTPDDVLLPWRLYRAGHLSMGAVGDALALLASAEVVADGRLRVRYRTRHFANLESVATGWLVPDSAWLGRAVAARLDPDESPPAIESARFAALVDQIDRDCGPGTGPYRLDPQDWRPREGLLLRRFEASWRRRARPGTWNFAAMAFRFRDQATARNDLLRAELDIYAGADAGQLHAAHEVVRTHYVHHLYDYPQLGVYRIVWNCARGPCREAAVRRAITRALDRQAILQRLSAARAAVAHAKPDAPAVRGLTPLAHDLPLARRALRAAGFDPDRGRPLRLRILALSGSDALRVIAEMLRSDARKAGIELRLDQRPLNAFVGAMKAEEWDGLLVMQSFAPSGDPFRFLHRTGAANYGRFRDPRADELAERARATSDEAARQALWRELHLLAREAQPATLIAHPLASVLVRRELRGLEPSRFGIQPERAWFPPERR